MTKTFTPVDDIVKSILDRLGVTSETHALFTIWEKEAGNLAQTCKDIYVKGGILYVEISSPLYIQELMLRKRQILQKINGHFAQKIISDIRYKMPRVVRRKGGPTA